MKVALLFDGLSVPPKDGVTYRVYHLARYLRRAGCDVELFLGDRGWTTDRQLQGLGVPTVVFPAHWLYGQQLSQVSELLVREKIDILHIGNSHPVFFTFGKELSIKSGAKVVVDMHDIDYHLLKSLGKKGGAIQRAKFFQPAIADMANGVTVVSPFDYNQLIALGVRSRKISCIPHGVEIVPRRKSKTARREFAFVGNMYYEPNYRAVRFLLNRVWPAIEKKYPHLVISFIGRTPNELRRLSRKNVHFVGEQDDLQTMFQKAISGLAPIFQGSGLKVKPLTYASFGLPVIATPMALSGYVSKRSFILAHTAQDFIRWMRHLAAHPIEANQRGLRLQQMVDRHYSWRAAAVSTMNLYHRVMSDRIADSTTAPTIRERTCGTDPKIVRVFPAPFPMWLQEKRYRVNRNRYPGRPRKITTKGVVWL